MLSTKVYSPLTVLRNCNSKVVIMHNSPYKDEIRAIADEKNMIILTDTSDTDTKSESILPYSNHFRPELGLLLMINAYNLTGGARLFPGRNKNSVYAVHEWTSIDNYVTLEKYINDTDPILYASLSNIRIRREPYLDDRLPKDWGCVEYMVVADIDGQKGQCIGFTNFKE